MRGFVRPAVRETLALNSINGNCRTFPVTNLARVPLEIPFREVMKEKFKRQFLLALPGYLLKSSFSHIGVDSISKLLTDVFDEEDIGTPEAFGAACLLATQRPTGWASRIDSYINFLSGNKKNGCTYPCAKARILLQTISNEYFWKTISEETQSSLERFISQLLSVLGVPEREVRMRINRLEQDRAKNILVSADFRL